MTQKIRTFVAIDPAPQVRERLVALRRELESCGADVRWARDEGLHCTLKFLGGVEPEQLEQVSGALDRMAPQLQSFELAARGVGVFPTLARARVVWAGLADAGETAALAKAVDDALTPLGFAPEARSFRPHITLGRVRSRNGLPRLAERLRASGEVELGSWRVGELVLYRSELQRGGSRYTPLARMALGGGSPMDNPSGRN